MNRYSFSIKEDNINEFYNLLTYLILNASIKKLETLEYVWLSILFYVFILMKGDIEKEKNYFNSFKILHKIFE
jgi:hypothetical protein